MFNMAIAFCKKLIGNNKRDYYHTFLHYLKKYNRQQTLADLNMTDELSVIVQRIAERFRDIHNLNKGAM